MDKASSLEPETIAHLINNAYNAGIDEGRQQVLSLLEKHKFGGVCGFIEQRVKELGTQKKEEE